MFGNELLKSSSNILSDLRNEEDIHKSVRKRGREMVHRLADKKSKSKNKLKLRQSIKKRKTNKVKKK